MRKVFEYQKAAKDCRKRAARAQNENEKKALEHLAATWEFLAETRQTQINKGLVQSIDEYGSPSRNRTGLQATDSLAREVAESD
jgi:hypothetical protein